jgi:L-fuculose-phosphate aldolase
MAEMAKCTEMDIREGLVRFGKMLAQKGFVAGTDGNLSARLNSSRILTTPTKINKGMMRAEDLVVVDLTGRKLDGRLKPSSEILMHLTIYKMRPDVNAIVHAHPCTATAFACSGMALDEPLCSEILVTLGEIPLAPYQTPGTPALGETLVPFIAEHDAILLANHGVVTYGEDLLAAYMNMETVEHFAKILLAARQLGRLKPLDAKSVSELIKVRSRYKLAHVS